MTRLMTILAASAALCAVAGCATREHSEMSESKTLAQPTYTGTPRESSAVAEVRGETAAAYSDDQTSVKLFERALAERPSALTEFNLAAAYGRTGRTREAIGMYQRAVGDGTNQTITITHRIKPGDLGADTTVNISDEARLRIALLEASLKPGERDVRPLSNAQAERVDAAQPK